MSSTTFQDFQTPILASWLNDVNGVAYSKKFPDATHVQTTEAISAPTGSSLVGFQQSGTGAVARTAQDKARESVSVLDFGAKADAIITGAATPFTLSSGTDNSAAFAAALTAAAGKRLYIPAGTYCINSALSIPSGTTLVGDGMNATRIVTALDIEQFTALGSSGNSDVLIRDIGFWNVSTTTAGLGATHYHIHAHNTIYWKVEDCYFKSNFSDSDFNALNHGGIWFSRDSNSGNGFMATIDNCWMDHCQVNMGISDSTIKGCHIWANTMNFAVRLGAPNIIVNGNNISGGRSQGGVWASTAGEGTDTYIDGSGQSNHNITGNNIDSGSQFNVVYGSTTGYGIKIDNPYNILISANRINQLVKAGIWINNASQVAISGNTFSDCNMPVGGVSGGYSDVEIANTVFISSRITVTGNSHVRSSSNGGTATQGYAIREMTGGVGSPTQCSYVGNTMSSYYNAGSIAVLAPVNQRIVGNSGAANFANEGTWVPADLSGAALTFTGATGRWALVDNVMLVWGELTFPVTANGAGVTIGGLPAPAISPGSYGGGGIMNSAVAAAQYLRVNNGQSYFIFFNSPVTAQATNVQCSGQSFSFHFQYLIA